MGKNTRTVMFKTDYGQFTLAVNPKEITISNDSSEKSIELLNVGQIVLPSYRGPQKLSINTFLPASSSPFYKGTAPEDIIAMVRKSKNGKRNIRIIVSGTDINTKFFVSTEQATYTEGQKDIKVAWNFVEDRNETIMAVAVQSRKQSATGLLARTDNAPVPKEASMKSGDTLWNMAVKYYQDGSRWTEIAEANGIKDTKNIPTGKRIVIPE